LEELFPNNVFKYNCKFDSLDSTTGRERVKLTGFEEFSKFVLDFLKKAVTQTYPNIKELNHKKIIFNNFESSDIYYETENQFHQIYLYEKLQFFINVENDSNIKDVINFVEDRNRAESCLNNLILTGRSFCGSLLLLYLIKNEFNF
jgi:hypothetical protein